MINQIRLFFLCLILGVISIVEQTNAQTFRKYATEGNDIDIQLVMNQNKTFSLYVLVPPTQYGNAENITDTVDYSGNWAEQGGEYILTFLNQPPFQVLFNSEYTPEGAVKILNNKSFAFNKSKPYVLIWGEICQYTN